MESSTTAASEEQGPETQEHHSVPATVVVDEVTTTEPASLTSSVHEQIHSKDATQHEVAPPRPDWSTLVSCEEEQKLKQEQQEKEKIVQEQAEDTNEQQHSLKHDQEETAASKSQRASKKGGKKKKEPQDPAQIPRKGFFFEHDNRQDDEPLSEAAPEVNNAAISASVAVDDQVAPQEGITTVAVRASEEEIASRDSVSVRNARPQPSPSKAGRNPNNVRQKYGAKIRSFGRRKQQPLIEGGECVDDEAVWSHDRFDLDEQQPKSKTEIVKVYGYDIREGENEKVNEIEPKKESKPRNEEAKGRPMSGGQPRKNVREAGAASRDVPQKNRVVSNSARRVLVGSDQSRSRGHLRPDHADVSANDDDQYCDYNEEEEENFEDERQMFRRRNGQDENENFIGKRIAAS